MTGPLDGKQFLGASVLLVQGLAVSVGNDSVLGAMDDQEGLVDPGDPLVVGKAITREQSDGGDGAEGGQEGRNEDEARRLLLLRKPAGRP